MNTPAHVILSAVALGRGRLQGNCRQIIAGALLPDLPMLVFYLYQRIGIGQSEKLIWSQIYFENQWQYFFDAFNSLPIIAVCLALAFYRKSWPTIALLLSMTLHVASDLPLHREDAHGHFFPITDWRYLSPISYWDPAHYGRIFGAIELLGVVVGSAILVRRGKPWRWVGLATLGAYVAFAGFAILLWLN